MASPFRLACIVFAGLLGACTSQAKISGSAAGTTVATTVGTTATEQPNVILIFADDIGVETVGAYGSEYLTPQLDAMASQGVRFDNAHATPICTPSRVRLLTGKQSYRNYIDFEVLDPKETVISEILKTNGYKTLVAGKWQLFGTETIEGTSPEGAGFDEYLVWNMENSTKGSRYWQPKLIDNGVAKTYAKSEFGPNIVNRRILDFIDKNQNEPFFIYYPMMLAHNPWVTTPVSLDAKTKKEKFDGMMRYLDKMVGNVLDKVEETGLSKNTLILFIGDNGTNRAITSLRHGKPVKGAKGNTINTGTNVPFLVQWKGQLSQGKVMDGLVEILDVLPSITEAANIQKPANLEGNSLLPYMRGESESVRDWIYIHYNPRPTVTAARRAQFVFNKKWKLYRDGRFYNMRIDPLEKSPLNTSTAKLNLESAFEAYTQLKQVLDEVDKP
jgi:arylsulfatase A